MIKKIVKKMWDETAKKLNLRSLIKGGEFQFKPISERKIITVPKEDGVLYIDGHLSDRELDEVYRKLRNDQESRVIDLMVIDPTKT